MILNLKVSTRERFIMEAGHTNPRQGILSARPVQERCSSLMIPVVRPEDSGIHR